MNVVVAGAGIMGCSLGLALAKRGCKVQIVDPSPCSGATACSWAWLNANKKNPQHYKELNMKGMEAWAADFPHLTHRCGSILLDDPHPSTDSAYPCASLSAQQLLELEPHLDRAAVSGRPAHHYPQESWVDPQAACSHMLQQAQSLGAELITQEAVEQILTAPPAAAGGGEPGAASRRVVGVVSSSGRRLGADVVVLACGPAVRGLAAQLGLEVPLLHKPARVALTSALPPRLLRAMLCSKEVFVMQRPDGTFMLGEPYECTDEDTSLAVGEAMLARACKLLPALQQATVEAVQIGYRPYPKDGHPIVGAAAEGLYICTSHSGMTLAPHLANLAAEEIASGGERRLAELGPYRPQRSFQGADSAYGWNLYHEGQQGKESV